MCFFSSLLVSWCAIFIVSSAASILPSATRELAPKLIEPIPPTEDPFYTAPRGYESKPPGTILRIRHAPGNLTSVIENCSAAYNIVYRTTNSLYKPAFAVTTLFIPTQPASYPYIDPSCDDTTLESALLSYQIPYDTIDLNDSPSFSLYSTNYTDIPQALGKGWFVNVPDFAGPLPAFLAGVLEGHGTLDSVRAALSTQVGISAKPRYAMWGYSGGSIASEFASELQQKYAPELKFAGMAIGGMPVNITSTLIMSSGGLFAGLVPAGMLGLTNQFPEAQKYLLSQLKETGPFNRTGFLAVRDMPEDEALLAYGGQDTFDYFVNGQAILNAPILKAILESNGNMGDYGKPLMPVFAYKAINDELSPVADSDLLIEWYCSKGVDIVYQRNTVGGHEAEATNGDAAAFAWLDAVLNGTYTVQSGCTVQNVTQDTTSSPI